MLHRGGEAGGALGAARLGWLATGGSEAEVCRVPDVHRRVDPVPAERDLLLARRARFTSIYAALAPVMGG